MGEEGVALQFAVDLITTGHSRGCRPPDPDHSRILHPHCLAGCPSPWRRGRSTVWKGKGLVGSSPRRRRERPPSENSGPSTSAEVVFRVNTSAGAPGVTPSLPPSGSTPSMPRPAMPMVLGGGVITSGTRLRGVHPSHSRRWSRGLAMGRGLGHRGIRPVTALLNSPSARLPSPPWEPLRQDWLRAAPACQRAVIQSAPSSRVVRSRQGRSRPPLH